PGRRPRSPRRRVAPAPPASLPARPQSAPSGPPQRRSNGPSSQNGGQLVSYGHRDGASRMGANVTDRLGLAFGSGTPARRAAGWLGVVALSIAGLERFWPVPFGVVLFGILVGSLTALGAFGMALVYRA